jgi:uncharacterized protein (UPF0548 family)
VRFALARGASWQRSVAWWRGRERTDARPGSLRADHHEVEIVVPPDRSADEAFDAVRERLLTYQHFPPSILRAHVVEPDARVREGSLIVQRALFPFSPIALEAGVVVTGVVDRADEHAREAAVAIATLDGHPEIGRERFAVTLDRASGRVTFTIDVESRPGPPLVRLARPITRWFQLRATKAILEAIARG